MNVTSVDDRRLVEGSDESRRQAREELRRHLVLEQAMRSRIPEVARSDLKFGRFGIIEDIRTGSIYKVRRGQLEDPAHSNAVAWYLAADGAPQYLEQPAGLPKTVAEAETKRLEREQRKAERAAQAAAPKRWARRAT